VPEVAHSALKAGDRLDKYLIVGTIGQGGMGVVFKARDTVLDRIVAIKVLSPHLTGNPTARQRFIQEGRAAAAVKDHHVVTIYAVEGHEKPYLVLEDVEGRSLQDMLAESAPLPVDEVVRLGSQIAQGLAAAHRKGLIHCDIKPANILLEHGTGRVAITDFGLARAITDPGARSGEFCGTPHYMAPEQVCGAALDHRADLFSLGSVLYYMCTGELPFAAPNTVAVLHRVTDDQPRPVSECNKHVPAWLSDLIAALHAKDPGHRIQSAEEVKDRLQARDGAPSVTHVLRPSARLSADAPRQPGRAPPAALRPAVGGHFPAVAACFVLPLAQEQHRNPGRPPASAGPRRDEATPGSRGGPAQAGSVPAPRGRRGHTPTLDSSTAQAGEGKEKAEAPLGSVTRYRGGASLRCAQPDLFPGRGPVCASSEDGRGRRLATGTK
jgi:serine/threonine protein kinase